MKKLKWTLPLKKKIRCVSKTKAPRTVCYPRAPRLDTLTPTQEKTGILEGLYLVARYTYVQGITVVSCVFMVEVTILDYSMKVRRSS